jgi:hypothetical protein
MSVLVDPRAAHLDKLVKILRMLGSSHDGERAAAGLKADQLVRTMGTTWSDIVAPKTLPAADVGDSIEAKIGTILANIEACSDWERGFITSVNGRPVLSSKQRAIVERLFRKATAYYAAKRGAA